MNAFWEAGGGLPEDVLMMVSRYCDFESASLDTNERAIFTSITASVEKYFRAVGVKMSGGKRAKSPP